MRPINHWRLIAAALLFCGGLWAACQSQNPATAPAADAATASAGDEGGDVITDVVIAQALARLHAAIADMKERGVPDNLIAERQAQVEAMLEAARNGTWEPPRTPEEYMAAFEEIISRSIERRFVTATEGARMLEQYEEAHKARENRH
ncbi:MAG: hypothetical protein F4Z65_07665 [Acidobacteria bacterium]|nr:hypothetical protein [Acidobacteriota bacterium]MYA44992.1 hypothetical protein [Acidobacteriota bacterium]MYI38569.1 hypothetical protein [Acidobacteriota bacterium]